MTIQPWIIAAMFAVSAGFLARRFWLKRNWLIFSAILPRLYLLGVYIYFSLAEVPSDMRAIYIRWGLALLIFVEIVNHIGARYAHDTR